MTSREEFEAFIQRRDPGLNMSRNMPDRSYNNPQTHDQWGGWQAARATAPAWHDAPTVPGDWICNDGVEAPYDWRVFAINKQMLDLTPPKGERWYGPIPKDAT